VSVHTGLITVEEYLKLPDAKEGRTELHHGEVVVMPPAKRGHQRRQRRIRDLLMQQVGETGVVETEMGFRPTPEYELWEADVAYVTSVRENAAGDDEYLTGAPDLVVEVLSPSNTVDEINDRMEICLDNGCKSFWVVDQKRKRVSVREGNVTRHYGLTDTISCALFPGEIQVRDIFA
jgi:Uma2 family endonuclease